MLEIARLIPKHPARVGGGGGGKGAAAAFKTMPTPKEILTFSACMRLPPERSKKEIAQLVEETLENLNLWKIRHSPVGDEERRGIEIAPKI